MKIKVFYQYYQNYYENRRKIREIVEKKLINPKCDVLLIETPIKKKTCWTDIFIRKPEIAKEVRDKIEDKGIRVMSLIADDFLGWHSQDLICFSTLARARKIRKILEQG